jgi:hypothetical protein
MFQGDEFVSKTDWGSSILSALAMKPFYLTMTAAWLLTGAATRMAAHEGNYPLALFSAFLFLAITSIIVHYISTWLN